MAPSSISRPSGSQMKKQASISSFFKPPASSKPPTTSSSVVAKRTKPSTNDEENLFAESADAETDCGLSSKRSLDEANISNEEEEAPRSGPKRRRSDIGDDSERTLKPIAPNGMPKEKAKISERTSRYLFSSSPVQDENTNENSDEDGDADAVRLQKERLHQKFVKKLGRPDAIAEIKRRNPWAGDEPQAAPEEEDDDDGEQAAEEVPTKSKGGRGASSVKMKGRGNKLTPMEKQVLEIKAAHPDTLLVVEVGYKYRFFGEDARVAAKELGIVCIPGKLRYDEHPSEAHLDRFASASIPTHRLHVHVKRLVQAGHKVGVVRQLETAALKAAGDNRNAPFVRKLTNLYTKGTYIDDVEGLHGASDGSPAPADTGYLLCLTETKARGWGTDEKVHVGFVAVQPATGDVIYDDFEDGFMRSEIETRLLHISPVEFLIVGELTKATEKIVQHLSTNKTNVFGDKARVERAEKPKTMAAQAYSHVSGFYASKMKTSNAENDARASALLEKVLKLSDNVTVCLSAMITYLSDYGLEHVFDLTKYFASFSARSHMLLNGTTLTSLEIYQNQTDHAEKGSLFWTLDRTQTRFGKRLLRKWVGRPLLDRRQLEERVAAVEELKDSEQSVIVEKLRVLLSKTKSDLEKSLIRIYYGKCTRPELLVVLQTLQRIANEFAAVTDTNDTGFTSSLINDAITSLPTISEDVVGYLDKINPEAASKDDKYAFFREEHETAQIEEHKLGIAGVEHDLDQYRSDAASKLKKKKVEYVSVGGIEYQIEVDNKHELKQVPASWVKISGTKAKSRFHTPEVIKMARQRDQHKESLAAACDVAFTDLLNEIASKYQNLRDCVQALATLDCLLSMAQVASQPGYVKPTFTEGSIIKVEKCRHPMVEQLLLDTYVANDIDLHSQRGTRALLITGPNMGGKSSYVRSVALIAIMGQIGSYVPAESAELGMLDAVFTRMGAQDNMLKGESTFMVELSETADILKQATPRSLVILDELGRGTSTHDGVAIAQAVLEHMVRQTKCLCLFITHYQNLSHVARAFDEGMELRNVHMSFAEQEGKDGWKEITFLYEVAEGMAHRSYGLNVARLANVPDSVLELAAVKSKELEHEGSQKRLTHLAKMLGHGIAEAEGLDELASAVEQL